MTEPIKPAKAAITDHSLKVNGPTWLAVCEGAVPVAMPWIASLIARIEADAATIKGLRETNSTLNRRATKAEGIVLSKARDEAKAGRSLGRALANAACAAYRTENQRLEDIILKVHAHIMIESSCCCGPCKESRAIRARREADSHA